MPALAEEPDSLGSPNPPSNLDPTPDEADRPPYFLLHKSSGYFLQGEPNPDAFTDNFKALWLAAPALVIGVPLFFAAIFSIGQLGQFLFFLVVSLFFLWMAYIIITRFIRTSNLQKRGKRLNGEITSLKAIHPGGASSLVSGSNYEMHLRYKFIAPSGQVLHGKGVANRNDLDGKPLPGAGTPVAILYLNDNFHMVL